MEKTELEKDLESLRTLVTAANALPPGWIREKARRNAELVANKIADASGEYLCVILDAAEVEWDVPVVALDSVEYRAEVYALAEYCESFVDKAFEFYRERSEGPDSRGIFRVWLTKTRKENECQRKVIAIDKLFGLKISERKKPGCYNPFHVSFIIMNDVVAVLNTQK